MEYGFFTFMMMKFYDECFFGVAAAIDARHRASQRWHDMVAGVSVKREKMPISLRVCGKVVILQRETQIGFCMDLLRFR